MMTKLVKDMQERRRHVKLVFLHEDVLHSMIDAPEGAIVERIDYDPMRRALVLTVSHPGFKAVAPFTEPPEVVGIVKPVQKEEFDLDNNKGIHMHLELEWNNNGA